MASLSTREIDISINEAFQSELSEEWLRTVVDGALQVALLPDEPGQVSLLVTDDATVRELNLKFRGLDEVTDVLSFSATHPGHWEGEEGTGPGPDPFLQDFPAPAFVFPEEEEPPLGEIIVSYPQACRQARERNEPPDRELALLIIHGVLHLVGHDHFEPDEAAVMQAREQVALETLFPSGTNS